MAVTARDVWYFLLTVALALAFVGAYNLSVWLTQPDDPPAPPLSVTSVDGAVFTLSEHRGSVVVVDFFATWCEPCAIVESRLGQVFNASEVPGLVIVSVGGDLDEDMNMLGAYQNKHAIPWTVARGTEQVLSDWGIQQFPHVVVVDKEGRMAAVFHGLPEPGQLERAIRNAA